MLSSRNTWLCGRYLSVWGPEPHTLPSYTLCMCIRNTYSHREGGQLINNPHPIKWKIQRRLSIRQAAIRTIFTQFESSAYRCWLEYRNPPKGIWRRDDKDWIMIRMWRDYSLFEYKTKTVPHASLKVLSNGAGGGPKLVSIDPFW